MTTRKILKKELRRLNRAIYALRKDNNIEYVYWRWNGI